MVTIYFRIFRDRNVIVNSMVAEIVRILHGFIEDGFMADFVVYALGLVDLHDFED